MCSVRNLPQHHRSPEACMLRVTLGSGMGEVASDTETSKYDVSQGLHRLDLHSMTDTCL